MTGQPKKYTSISEATQDVLHSAGDNSEVTDLFGESVLQLVIPDWTEALSGFEANTTVTRQAAHALEQIEQLYHDTHAELERRAAELNVGKLNEHGPATVLFMILVRRLQDEYASKQNLNPHKIAVLLQHRYSIE